MQDPLFQRTIENFTCENCGAQIVGTGYTNHCPRCLWSKHVDINPGDRKAGCSGMMQPIRLEGSSPHYRIVHKCKRCGIERIVDVNESDDTDSLIALAGKA